MKRNPKSKKWLVYIFLVGMAIFISLIIARYTSTGKAFEDGQRVQQCRTDGDCSSEVSCFQGVCGACISNDDCTLMRPVCSNNGMCGGCESDQECPQDHFCNEGGECEFRGGVCQRDEDCTDFQVCENNRCLTAEGNSCISDLQCATGMMCDTGYCYPLCRDSDEGIDILTQGVVEYGRWPVYGGETRTQRIGSRVSKEKRDSCLIKEVLNRGQSHFQWENFCDIDEQGAQVGIYCQGRKQCVEGVDSCIDVALAEEGAACRKDEECSLGLVCETNTCQRQQPSAQFGRIIPDTLGQVCQTDNDCQGNVGSPAAVCEDNVCRAGAGSDCRTGCSMRYPCTNICSVSNPCSTLTMIGGEPGGEEMCGPLQMQSGLTPVGGLCQNHDNCDSGACINLYYPLLLGRCEERLKGAGQQCFVNNDCKSGDCTQNFCQGNPEYGACTDNTDCVPGLACQDGLCLKRNAQETALSENGCELFRELIPGHNNPQEDRINLAFVLVNAPEDLLIRQKLTKYINFISKDEFGKNSLFNIDPFKSNKDKFNLWYVNEIQQVSPPSTYQKCYAVCGNPHKETASCTLKNKKTANVCFMSCRGTAGSDSLYEGTSLNPQGDMKGGAILTHELGHAIGKLKDEYVEEKISLMGFPNCAATREQAKQWWGDLEGRGEGDLKVDYVSGCSYTPEQIKPSKNSLMNHPRLEEQTFGDVNYRHLCYQILKNTKKVDAACLRAIMAAPKDAYHEMYTTAVDAVTGSAVADAPAKSKSVAKPKIPASPTPKINKLSCNQNSVCDKRNGETQFTCPTDCGKTVVNLNLKRKAQGVYEIQSYSTVERVPYLPYFEDSGIFEAQLTINSENQRLTKYFNLRTPEITETFTDGPTVPPELRGRDNIRIEDLHMGGISLDDFQLVYADELSIDVPLGGTPLTNRFSIILSSPALGVSQSFTCQQGTCQEEFSK